MIKRITQLVLMGAVFALTACSTTGLDSSSKFKCRIGDTVDSGCKSISEVYAESGSSSMKYDTLDSSYSYAGKRSTPYSGMPIRTTPRVLRLWIAPWEDLDGDLRDQAYMYLALNESRWQIAHNQEAIMNEYSPTITLLGQGGDKASTTTVKANIAGAPDIFPTPVIRTDDPVPAKSVTPQMAPPNLIPAPNK